MEVKGNLVVHGNYVDIHDNQTVNLKIDRADQLHVGQGAAPTSAAPTDEAVGRAMTALASGNLLAEKQLYYVVARVLVDLYHWAPAPEEALRRLATLPDAAGWDTAPDWANARRLQVTRLSKPLDEWDRLLTSADEKDRRLLNKAIAVRNALRQELGDATGAI